MLKLGVFFKIAAGASGRWLARKITDLLDLLGFFTDCLSAMIRYRHRGRWLTTRAILQQIYFTGVQSLELICSIALLVGGLVVIQGTAQLTRVGSREGLAVLLTAVIIREVGPLLTAVVVALRSGSAIAIEMGYMTVLREIESIEMQGIHPLHLLAVPRLVGVTAAVMCLSVFYDVVSIGGGFFAAWVLLDIPPWSLLNDVIRTLGGMDVMVGLVKALFFGTIISVVCLHQGFRAGEAMTNVPPQASRALVQCFIFCILVNVLVSVVFYL
jgi:phospholipid/cholesterol/gamma-HCH transport system permease protein